MRDPKKKYRLTKVRLNEISLVDFGADPNALVTIFKRGVNSGSAAQPQGERPMTELEQMAADMRQAAATITALTKRATDAETALEAATTRATNAEARAEAITKMAEKGETEDLILKSADPIVAAEIIKLRKANAAAAAALAAMQETAEIKKFAEQIATDLPGLPVKADVLAPVLKRIAGAVTPEDMDTLNRILKAGSEALLNVSKTSRGLGFQEPVGAEAALNAKATEISKAEGVTLAKAHALALERNPELYTKFLAERGAAN